MIRILAFDPGGTTGWAKYVRLDDGHYQFTCGEIGPHRHHTELWNLLRNVPGTRIVTESFEYRNDSREGLELVSREYIGVMQLYCDLTGLTLVQQSADQGKIREPKGDKSGSFVKRSNLERLGLWRSGMKHAMDGYGHLLYYMINRQGAVPPEVRLDLLKRGWRS